MHASFIKKFSSFPAWKSYLRTCRTIKKITHMKLISIRFITLDFVSCNKSKYWSISVCVIFYLMYCKWCLALRNYTDIFNSGLLNNCNSGQLFLEQSKRDSKSQLMIGCWNRQQTARLLVPPTILLSIQRNLRALFQIRNHSRAGSSSDIDPVYCYAAK